MYIKESLQLWTKGENGRKMGMRRNKNSIFCMPGTAEQPDTPNTPKDEYDLPDVPTEEEPVLTPTVSPAPTEIPANEAETVVEPTPTAEPTQIVTPTPVKKPESTNTPVPTATPMPTVTPTPEPTEVPLIEIEDEDTPLAGGVDGILSDVLDGANYIGDLYTESLYVEVRPLAEFYVENKTLGKGTIMMIVGGTLMLSATIVMIGAMLTRRARKLEEEKWK